MFEFNIEKILISFTRMTLERMSYRIKILSNLSETFFAEKDLQQDSLFCLLFNIALEKAIRGSDLNTSGTTLQRFVQLLVFADRLI